MKITFGLLEKNFSSEKCLKNEQGKFRTFGITVLSYKSFTLVLESKHSLVEIDSVLTVLHS